MMTMSSLQLTNRFRLVVTKQLQKTKVACCRCFSSSRAEIPIPSGDWPILGHLPRIYQDGDGAKSWKKMHEECGEVVRAKFPGGKSFVITSNPEHAKEVLMNQGKYPYRIKQHSWEAIYDEKGWPSGIPNADGEDWKRRRKVLGETLLMSKNAKEYVPVVTPAANHFVECLTGHLNQEGRLEKDGPSIRDFAAMFALEAVMKVVVGADFPALTVPLNQKAVSFAQAVETMFAETRHCENLPLNIKWKLQPYQKLKAAWEEMYGYAKEKLDPILEHYETHGKLPDDTQGTVLPKLIQEYEAGNLSMKEVQGIGVQAISAAVDTTGQTTEYLLYNLAKNPIVQEKLAKEVTDVFGSAGPLNISVDQYQDQQYLFAVLKESMRITPTIGVHVRTLVQDAQLGDYQVDKGEVVFINYQEMTKNPDIFPEPDLFLPERFLKQKRQTNESGGVESSAAAAGGCPMAAQQRAEAMASGKAVCNDPYAAIPFGHGGRKCVGKGFAEMDIHLLAIALLRKFKVHYDGPDLDVVERSLLRPKEPIFPHLRFEPRN